jgi:hypothetical protein
MMSLTPDRAMTSFADTEETTSVAVARVMILGGGEGNDLLAGGSESDSCSSDPDHARQC